MSPITAVQRSILPHKSQPSIISRIFRAVWQLLHDLMLRPLRQENWLKFNHHVRHMFGIRLKTRLQTIRDALRLRYITTTMLESRAPFSWENAKKEYERLVSACDSTSLDNKQLTKDVEAFEQTTRPSLDQAN